jgi:anti-sigma regulatory factor (Ser/Thr protein kinase)
MRDRTFFVCVPADSRYLRAIRSFYQPLLEEVFGESATQMLILALDEACSNIIKHSEDPSGGRSIEIQSLLGACGVRFRIRDFCGEQDVPNIKPRDLQARRAGGLGTHFISRIMDRVVFEPDPDHAGRVALVMEKSLPACDEGNGNETRGD